jgi:DNA-binding NtrC family response regulator
MTKEEKQKALALKIAKVANQIVPELARLTAGTEFQLTILNDGEGFGLQVFVAGDVQVSSIVVPQIIKREHEDEAISEYAKIVAKWHFDIPQTARAIGISEETLRRKVEEYRNQKQDEVEVVEVAEGEQMEEKEKECLAKALEQTNGDKRKAAELIGVSERSFFRKCKKYGIKFGARK